VLKAAEDLLACGYRVVWLMSPSSSVRV